MLGCVDRQTFTDMPDQCIDSGIQKAILGLLEPERGHTMLPQNVGDYFPPYTASHP